MDQTFKPGKLPIELGDYLTSKLMEDLTQSCRIPWTYFGEPKIEQTIPLQPKKPTTFEEALDQVLAGIRAELIAKHHDYGTKNLMRRGQLGLIVRSEDKLARVENLQDKSALVEGEDITKSWLDVAGYAIQGILMNQGQYELPMTVPVSEPKVAGYTVKVPYARMDR
jgi:hypothetical protein